MGLAYLGIGFGGAAVPWITSFLYTRLGWQGSLRVLGVIMIVIALPFALAVKERPKVETEHPGATSAQVKNAFKTLSLWLLILGSMCSIAAVSGAQHNLKLLLSLDRHYAQSGSARIVSLVLAFSIVGRILMGWMADRISKKYVMLLIYLLVAAGIPFLFLSANPLVLAVAAAVFGIGLGGDFMIIPLMTAEIFDIKILGRLMGVILTAGGVAEALSPMLIGHLRDTSGNYQSGCMVLVLLALLGASAVVALPKSRRLA